jgi:DNA repair photolyase
MVYAAHVYGMGMMNVLPGKGNESMVEILEKEAKNILTPQRSGSLASGPYPFTHACSSYVGCGFGQTTCGMYCYAQYLPNWLFRDVRGDWGQAIQVKTNAAQLLEQALSSMKPEKRKQLRIFMSSSTDPYQPIERRYQITRQCLDVFARFQDLDLLLIQTRSPLAARDIALFQQIPYAFVSVTIETNDQQYLKQLKGGPMLEKRWELVQAASASGVPTQIAVSPCLPYRDGEAFGQRLLHSGARRIVVDTMIDGDGSQGKRTAHSPFALSKPGWRDTSHAHRLYNYLCEKAHGTDVAIGWSTAGFSGIAPRSQTLF